MAPVAKVVTVRAGSVFARVTHDLLSLPHTPPHTPSPPPPNISRAFCSQVLHPASDGTSPDVH